VVYPNEIRVDLEFVLHGTSRGGLPTEKHLRKLKPAKAHLYRKEKDTAALRVTRKAFIHIVIFLAI
jgi:hypothetical protein